MSKLTQTVYLVSTKETINMMEKTREGLTTVITDRCLLYSISGRASLVLMSKTQIAALREFSRMAVAEETKTKFF